jgi:hypothetical protein
MSAEEEQVSIYLNYSLSMSSNITSALNTFTSSMPFSIYFLGYINYLSLSSLYVVLNFPIPEQTYNHLADIYQQLNTDLLQLFGVDIEFPPLSYERVDDDRAL